MQQTHWSGQRRASRLRRLLIFESSELYVRGVRRLQPTQPQNHPIIREILARPYWRRLRITNFS